MSQTKYNKTISEQMIRDKTNVQISQKKKCLKNT